MYDSCGMYLKDPSARPRTQRSTYRNRIEGRSGEESCRSHGCIMGEGSRRSHGGIIEEQPGRNHGI